MRVGAPWLRTENGALRFSVVGKDGIEGGRGEGDDVVVQFKVCAGH